jgi:hypothetical protein
MKFFKIWIQTKGKTKKKLLFFGEVSPVQYLFDKIPIDHKVVKYQEITEKSFERALSHRAWKYQILEEYI